MIINVIRKVYYKVYRYPLTWFIEFAIPNVNNPRKLIRGIKWKILPKYKQFPPFIVIDPIVNCNLDCPLCSIPPKLHSNYGLKLSLEDFKKHLDKIKEVTNKVFFCHAGEPFLNKDLFEMVKLVNRANMISWVGTNGTLLNRSNAKMIFENDLDILQISFDGFSKESYEKYRIGADFDQVLIGIDELVKTKKKLRRRKPLIELTFLLNSFNVHEVEIARKYFSNIGITFLLKGINLNIHRRNDGKEHQDLAHWIAIGHQYSKYEKDKDGNIVQKAGFKDKCDTCLKPVITCNGDILLCCHDIFKSINLGNINDTYDLKEFWLSEKYKNIRRMATERELPLCKKCGV